MCLSKNALNDTVFFVIGKKSPRKTLKEIDKMKGLDFEVFIGELLTQHGYKTQNIKGSGDFGVDVIAEKGNTKYAVQVKRYKSNVSRTAVSDAVAGKFHWDCEKAWVITNSYFTSDAKLLAKSTDCKLTDRDELKNMMKDGSTFASIFEGSSKKERRPFWRSIWGAITLIGIAALAFYVIRFIPQSSVDKLWNQATSVFSSGNVSNTIGNSNTSDPAPSVDDLTNSIDATDVNVNDGLDNVSPIILDSGDSLQPIESNQTPALIPTQVMDGSITDLTTPETPIQEATTELAPISTDATNLEPASSELIDSDLINSDAQNE